MLKSVIAAVHPGPGIFRIETKGFRGFQFGNPQSRPREIDVELYSDHGELNFIFTHVRKGGGTAISQAEINRVIQTVKAVQPATPSTR